MRKDFLFVLFCFVIVKTTNATSPLANRFININIYGGQNPYVNSGWNNWNEPANKTSQTLSYSDGVNSGVTITTSTVLPTTDNGTNYPTTMCPTGVGRYTTFSTLTSYTLTINNLKTDGSVYDLEIYASRNNTGNSTRFTVNGAAVNINTSSNYSNAAVFANLVPNNNGQIIITVARASGTYAYVNGLTITEIGDQNRTPIVDAGSNQSITLPQNEVTLSGSGTDPDGSISSFLWTKISGPGSFSIQNPTEAQTTVSNLIAGNYAFEFKAIDNLGAVGRDTVMIVVNAIPPPNQNPVAIAGIDQTITLPINYITLIGTGVDNDGTIISYFWSKISGPLNYSIATPTSSQTVVNNLETGSYGFELTVTDNNGAIGKDTVIVTVNPPIPPNQYPIANAGTDQTITLPTNTVVLSGSGSFAGEGATISNYLWTKIAGPSGASISGSSNITSTITFQNTGTYTFELKVTNNNLLVSRDSVLVTVKAALPYAIPVNNITNPSITLNLPANSVALNSTYTLTGAALKNIRWSKTKSPAQTGKKLAWIGSSTLVGTGATTNDSAVVWRVGNYYTGIGALSSWVNLAVGGANIFQGMPTGYIPTGVQSAPDITHNVTTAINQGADIIIVGYPSNAYDGSLSITEILFAYRTIYNTVVNAGKKCFIMTSQPRPEFGATGRALLKQIADSIIAQYPNNYIQAYYNLIQSGTTNALYNAGDNIHQNNTGHRVLFNSVVARNIFEGWSGSSATINTPDEQNTTITDIPLGKNIFQVTVTDAHEQSITDTISITIKPEPGIEANAGPDITVLLPVSEILFSGSGSTGAVSFLWRQIAGPASTILSPTNVNTGVSGIIIAGTYVYELSINNGASRDTVTVYANEPGVDKYINVNIYGGQNPYVNNEWNNWNEPANKTSQTLSYSDGVNAGVTITTSAVFSTTDNGTGYPTTMCPAGVGRYATFSTLTNYTLTINNLKKDGTVYGLAIYASRKNTGNTTRFTVNGTNVDINTSSNYANAAVFNNLLPNSNGQIIITVAKASGTYTYVNGLTITEVGLTNKTNTPLPTNNTFVINKQ